MPTVLDLAGAPARAELSGRSLRPALDGSAPLPVASIYSESLSPRYHFGWSELYALSDDRYRLIRAPTDELYDLAQDPAEKTSIAADRAQVTSAMRGTLDKLIANAAPGAPAPISDEDRQKLAALGYVGTQSAGSLHLAAHQLPDPKDKIHVLQKYRQATDLAGQRRFAEAAALYRELLRDDPGMSDVWLQLADIAIRRGLLAEAVEAYGAVLKRNPKDPAALTGAAASLLRLRRLPEARAHAELAVEGAPATARQLLARIAIEMNEPETAKTEARLAHAADPTLPMPAFVEGVILHRQGRYAAAIPPLIQARDAMASRTVQIPDVNYYIADSLARLERYAEAEPYFKAELVVFPSNVRARAGLAMMYRAMGLDAQSEQAIAELVRQVPTPEGLDVGAQLWTMFGEPGRAAALRAAAAASKGRMR
jgi:tetratricopeptide (TPR) repeat protein